MGFLRVVEGLWSGWVRDESRGILRLGGESSNKNLNLILFVNGEYYRFV